MCLCPSSSELIHRFITEHQQGKRVPLCINPQSAAFKTFIRWGRVWARSGDDAAHCFQLLYLTKALVPSGPLRGTRPRCPGRRRDERGSSSSRGATAACETISSENTDEFGSFLFLWGMQQENDSPDPLELLLTPPHPQPPTNPEYEIYSFTFLTTQTADASRRFRCWIQKKKMLLKCLRKEENKWTRYWIGFSMLVETNGLNCLVELLVFEVIPALCNMVLI